MTEIVFVAHNRLAYTQASFGTLLDNTDWSRVRTLHVLDDRSTDGTAEWLRRAAQEAPVKTLYASRRFNGPVAAMNHALRVCNSDLLCKIDNDVVVCPGWLDALLDVMIGAPELSVLGFEPGFGEPVVDAREPRGWRPAQHVGGVALIRTRIFAAGRRARPNGRFGGWTEYQRRGGFQCGWVTPDLPCFLLDHLPMDPWRSLAEIYAKRGWSRSWPVYDDVMSAYWSWWLPSAVAA